MGRAACRLSDHVVITSDNPRFEEPQAIIKDIEKGVNKEFTNYDIVIDRRKAIERALKLASHGDIVVIAGKGHENYQIVKDKVLNFDDRKIAREVMLNAR
jgi:UDP-N-acetylmuramoyl-L-alanyl-D-glutamate--2,6-diaminopimelate ligase